MAEPAVQPRPEGPRRRLRAAPAPPATGLPGPAREAVRAPGEGEPIAPEVRDRIGRSLGVDLGVIRVHADTRAHEAAASVHARAFAYGSHIFLGRGERRTDADLIAHEAAHVVQQQGAPALQLYAGPLDALEREAAGAASAVHGNASFRVAGRTSGARVQRQDRQPGLLRRGWTAITGAVSAGVDVIADLGWSLLRRFAPELEPIIRQGIFEWLKERIVSAIQSVYETLTAPIRTVFEFLDFLHSHFRQLVDWMREAAGKIARGDCSSIQEAAHKVHDVLAGIGHAVLDRVKAAARRVGDFFQRLWDRFGAPVWDFLRSVGGAIWERIQAFGAWVWEKTQPIRDAAARAWTWVKNQLGVGEGPEGQNGLLQWVQRKAGEAWDWLKTRLEPFKRPLMVVGGILLMFSPAGPIIALGAGIGGLIYGVRWIAQHLRSSDAVVSQRGLLEGTIIPAIQRAVSTVVGGVSHAAAWLTEKLGAVAGAVGSAAGAIAGSIFSFMTAAANWLLDKFRSLVSWANEKVHGLAQWIGDGLARLRTFLEPVLDVLRRFGRVITNILEIAQLVVTRVWNAIPACIRDPIVNFLVNQILRRIPIFASLLQIPEIWSRIRTFALTVIRQVFHDGDLRGAAMTVFRFLLDLLRVPVQLVVGIFQKAGAALDLIVARPIDFLRNVLVALKDGFIGFVRRIMSHLLSGVVRWLTSTLAEAGVTVPTDWTFGSVFRFVLDILGITLERVLEILARKVGQPVVDRIRRFIAFMTGAWEFVSVFIREGVGGLWRYVQQRISDLWETVKGAIVGWISRTLIGRVVARLLTMLDPTGIGAVINSIITIYRAIESAVEYLRGILEIIDRWMDMLVGLARGATGAAAQRFEDLLDRALPIAIGFLANQVGLRNLGTRIREMIEVVQERVAQAIEWLIDQALRIGRAILERLGVGGGGRTAAPFGEGADRHSVYVEESGGRQQTMIATTPTPAAQAIADIKTRIPNEIPAGPGRAEAVTLANNTSDEIDKWEAGLSPSGPPPPQASQAYVNKLAQFLGPLYGLIGHPSVPETVMKPPTAAANGMAGEVQAAPLTRRAPAGKPGQESRNAALPSDADMSNMNKVRQIWVKMHLISFRLHGRDESTNFAPGSKAANDAMAAVEWEVIDELKASEGRKIMWYRTVVQYRTQTLPPPSPDARRFPKLVKMTRGPYDPVKNEPLAGTKTTDIESPSPTAGAVSLSSASIPDMVGIGIPRSLAQTIFDGRVIFGRPYRGPEDLVAMINQTARFSPARLVGGQMFAIRQVGSLNSLIASGAVVWQDQE